jgi:hypothetical protein
VLGSHLTPATNFSPFFNYFWTITDLLMWDAISDEKSGSVVFSCLLDIVSAAFLRSEFHGTHEHISLSLLLNSPNLEGQVISLRNRVAQGYFVVGYFAVVA